MVTSPEFLGLIWRVATPLGEPCLWPLDVGAARPQQGEGWVGTASLVHSSLFPSFLLSLPLPPLFAYFRKKIESMKSSFPTHPHAVQLLGVNIYQNVSRT